MAQKKAQSLTANLVQKQKGAVLVMALIILVILGVVSTTGVGQVTQEYHLASNMDRYNRNFQGADSALSWCESSFFVNRNFAPLVDGVDLYSHSDSNLSSGWWRGDWSNLGVEAPILGSSENDANIRGMRIAKCVRQEVDISSAPLNLPNKMASQSQSSLIRRNGIRQYKVTAFAQSVNSVNTIIVQSDYFSRFE